MKHIAVLILILLVAASATAAVPPMISYQGKLMQPSGIPVPDGAYSIRFAIYDAPTAGNTLWSETNPSVQVKGGLFATMLGSVVNLPANIFDSSSRFFGVKVGGDLEMTPRQQVASVAFAVKAASADTAATAATVSDGAIVTTKLADKSVASAKIADSAVITTAIADSAVNTSKIADGAVTAAKLGPAVATTHTERPQGATVVGPSACTFGDFSVELPGPGKLLVLADVTLQHGTVDWVSLRVHASQGAVDLSTPSGMDSYGGSSGSYWTLPHHQILQIPSGGTWTVGAIASTPGSVNVWTYTISAIYLGQ